MKCVCPDSNLEKHERIREIFRNIEEWIQSDALQSLVRLFGGEKMETAPLKAQIQWLNNFVEIWDYRSRNQNTDVNERWNVFDDEFVLKHKDEIMNCATKLGLVQETTAVRIPDYIIPLGGARYSNLDRPMYAGNIYHKIRNANKDQEINIVALAGSRPINEKERAATDTYAPDAVTEFDAICRGLEEAFYLNGKYRQDNKHDENINLCSAVRTYECELPHTNIIALAAPSTEPLRRANSRDTFEYFLDYYHIKKGDNLLLVTSQIYVPYQWLKFIDLALEGAFHVECVGYSMCEKEALAKPSNFLQEIKGTVNAIAILMKKYENV